MATTFILSDNSLNSHGFRVPTEKINLERFRKHPVMLYNHKTLIGKWDNIRIEDDKLLAEPNFKDDEVSLGVKKDVEAGYINCASIGGNPLDVEVVDGELHVTTEMFECSIVDVPSNANAMKLYSNEGVMLEGEAFELKINEIKGYKIMDKPTLKLSHVTLGHLGIAEGAKSEEINAAVAKLAASNADLKGKLDAVEKQKAEELVSLAVADGRILAGQKENFLQLAANNFDLAKSTLEVLPTKKTLAGKEAGTAGAAEGREKWTFEDWRKKDTVGLLSIKKSDPEVYQEILKRK